MTPDDKRHGTRSGYVAGCRTDCCLIPNRRWIKQYRLNASRNGGRTTVPSEPIRQHVIKLQQTMSLSSIGEASRTSSAQLSRLLRGTHPRMRPGTAAALLAVRPDAAVGGHYVSSVGSMRRIQALVAVGYSFESLERHLKNYGRSNIRMLAYGKRDWITSDTAAKVKAVYDELSMRMPIGETKAVRSGITRARNRARQLGWVTSLAWDDDKIDDPKARPAGVTGSRRPRKTEVDEVVVQRFIDGTDCRDLTRAEREEAARRLRARGVSDRRIEHQYGLKPDRYLPAQQEQVKAA